MRIRAEFAIARARAAVLHDVIDSELNPSLIRTDCTTRPPGLDFFSRLAMGPGEFQKISSRRARCTLYMMSAAGTGLRKTGDQ